jgi:hypothetical protein
VVHWPEKDPGQNWHNYWQFADHFQHHTQFGKVEQDEYDEHALLEWTEAGTIERAIAATMGEEQHQQLDRSPRAEGHREQSNEWVSFIQGSSELLSGVSLIIYN